MVENGFSARIPYGEPTFHPYVIASVHQNVGFKSMLGDSVRQKISLITEKVLFDNDYILKVPSWESPRTSDSHIRIICQFLRRGGCRVAIPSISVFASL